MANNPSALKRVRQTEARTLRNRVIKTRVKSLRKKIDEAVQGGERAAIDKAIGEYSSAVDRAAQKNLFHKNKAANLKSKAVAFAKSGAQGYLSYRSEAGLSERARKAREIAEHPTGYKVCEGCESIVGSGVVICPNCHGYRFDENSSRVVEQALVLGSREQQSVTAEDLH